MDFSFKLSELFPNEVSIVNNDLIPIGCPKLEEIGTTTVKERVAEVLDKMGEMSTKAHSLHMEITNAQKIEKKLHQKVYIFCDFHTNQTVGLLKIGLKTLVLFDEHGAMHEMHPMCILDFYIHTTRQRKGAGHFLFEKMLANEGLPVEHFAVDSPSHQLVGFLKKHYGLTHIMPQTNHFVIYKGFFNNRKDLVEKTDFWARPDQTPGEKAWGKDPRGNRTQYEDSFFYNEELSDHLKNCRYHQPDFTEDHSHDPSIGQILHPSGRHSHAHTYGHGNQDSCNWFSSKYTDDGKQDIRPNT